MSFAGAQYAMPSRSYSYPQAPPGFPQLPFNGPPPKPPHIRVNPQDWQNGSWAINPAFNSSQWSLSSNQSQSTQAQPWAPSQAWHQQRQQEWQAQQQQMAAAAQFNPYKRVPRPPSAEYLATKLSDNPLGLSNMVPRCAPLSREMTDPTPQSQRRTNAPARHSSEPPAERRPPSTDTLPNLDRPLDRPRQYQSQSYQPETFTSSRDLQPTFSTNIVRTPQHYKSRSSSAGPSQSIYAPPTSRGSIDSQLASRMEHLSTQSNGSNFNSSQSNGLSRQSSLPAQLQGPPSSSSMSGVSSFVDEPASMLSPLVLPSTSHKPSTRPLGRHSSVPAVSASSSLSAIPEGPGPSDSTRRSPHRHGHAPRRSRHTSPFRPPPVPSLTPPRSNPLPDPPQELGRNPSITLPVQRTPPAHYRARLRKGMWNRRGDHLTMDGYVVYAPLNLAYPVDLRDYPAETAGYRDHLGSEIGYLDSRPELPESLPRFGQPPRQPYEKVHLFSSVLRALAVIFVATMCISPM
ncbi:hypothetical protein C8R43DRAFT_1019388 [Mycena crocata]|nr:hypothetical protein C8R43DRAFT_1019388 [Mycena crocata]